MSDGIEFANDSTVPRRCDEERFGILMVRAVAGEGRIDQLVRIGNRIRTRIRRV